MAYLILIVGIIVTAIFTLLWCFDVVQEPIIPICTSFLTFLGYFIANRKDSNKTTIKQKHSGTGDNVAGDKVTNIR